MHIRLALSAGISAVALASAPVIAAAQTASAPATASASRERTDIDADWRFALGHAHDPARDFGYGTAAFFFAKAGYGDGPASPKFDDRAWRKVDVPHDWGVEVPFDAKAETNHGSRAIGPGFPEHNIGWYRKTLSIPESDRGRRVAVEFDGVFRDAAVWFNGHYIGQEHSGYSGVRYDLTDYINYGGPNTLVVRADTSTFEGWFYEGAGIYRHVWLTKTDPLHVAHWGTFVTSELTGADARVTARATIANDDRTERTFTVDQEILSPDGRRLALVSTEQRTVASHGSAEVAATVDLKNAALWSLEQPRLHQLVTTVREGGQVRDRYVTDFGVRSIRWDADTGFWLNGRNIKLQGTNNHQDHAGIGAALPDEMQVYRLERLKAMGANAYRASHNPPTPEMLDAADRLGMLVIDEHRMMGTTPEIRDQLDRLILRDRNHPSVILWSVGNEEWGIEGKEIGARLTTLMQERVHELDQTRPTTAATAGNDGRGISTTTEVAGFNYRSQHDVDVYHRDYPRTPIAMTEEGSTFATRGVYFDDRGNVHLAAYDKPQRPTGSSSIEQGWRAVMERPWMAGMFVWTGFDYRGETTPFGWPAISSQFGMLDTTGLFKDSAWFLKSQWTSAPMAHIVGHWNWPGREGQPIPIWVYANADEAELTLNGRSLGRRRIPAQGHAEWQVPYAPGKLVAIGYRAGKRVASDQVVTTGPARTLSLSVDRPDTPTAKGNVAVIDVTARDGSGRIVPVAADDVRFTVRGAEILGVGNGDPGSHEADRFVDGYQVQGFDHWQIADLSAGATTLPDPTTLSWRDPFRWYAPGTGPKTPEAFALRGRLAPSGNAVAGRRTLFLPQLADGQHVLVNGADMTARATRDGRGWALPLDANAGGAIDLVIVVPGQAQAALGVLEDEGIGGKNVAYLQTVTPAGAWHRQLFNGHAQIIVKLDQAHPTAGLTATAAGLRPASVSLRYDNGGSGPRAGSAAKGIQ
ncbi:beta-galactosidase GalA [uncultured Sphingomonas sp.]|uniref:beta-galactosidase GalA n=1 Tax=uncultured Sphingomonas sp. TaxID=158754 RepID=UPI0025D8FA80|nr:beta-galactosidase GalA [uncultured Sphingomonas sp.]